MGGGLTHLSGSGAVTRCQVRVAACFHVSPRASPLRDGSEHTQLRRKTHTAFSAPRWAAHYRPLAGALIEKREKEAPLLKMAVPSVALESWRVHCGAGRRLNLDRIYANADVSGWRAALRRHYLPSCTLSATATPFSRASSNAG